MVNRMSVISSRGRFFMFIAVFVIISIIYFYWSNAEENYKHSKWAEKRCLSELSSVKYQLDVVTEYKTHVETMLTDCQKEHNADKDKFKEVAENCVTMKQQWSLCQNQFDDLQNECKKVRQNANKEQSEIEILKKKLNEELMKRNETQKTIENLFEEIASLKKINRNLIIEKKGFQEKNRNKVINHFKKDGNPKIFSEQVEVSQGEYNIVMSNTTHSVGENPISTKSYKESTKSKEEKLQNNLPPGFAPVLPVFENLENVNQHPPQVTNNLAQDKVKKKKYNENKAKDKDLEIIENVQDSKANEIEEDNEGLHVAFENDKKIIGNNLNNPNDINGAQEDDDEGEEYAAN